MAVALVTGASGLVGSEAVQFYSEKGFDVVGIDNDMRSYFFGDGASTRWKRDELVQSVPGYTHVDGDIREQEAMERVFKRYGKDIAVVLHAASQPSHDWAAREPHTDFTVNANGTLVMLECTRHLAPDAVFIFTSTNKVYGDRPNSLPLQELETRWEIDPRHAYAGGIDESMSIDATKHSLFGASKAAADLLVQEYGRYFEMPTACFRAGCITGPSHSGAQLHGFLAYLMKCIVSGTPYSVFGYGGKQVRDNIHARDLVEAFYHFQQAPRVAEVYNIGGGRESNCSMLEAIALGEQLAGTTLKWTYEETNRIGDHIWWISDLAKFQGHYPGWSLEHGIDAIMGQIYENNVERWLGTGAT